MQGWLENKNPLYVLQCKASVFLFGPSAQMRIGCDNSVVRLVSSGNYINRVSFQYRLLEQRELPKARENSLDNFCAVEWDHTHFWTCTHTIIHLSVNTPVMNAINKYFFIVFAKYFIQCPGHVSFYLSIFIWGIILINLKFMDDSGFHCFLLKTFVKK